MEKVFTWISRINSVILLLLLIGAACFATWRLLEGGRDSRRPIVTVSKPGETGYSPGRFIFGNAETIGGTDTLMVPLGLTLPSGITTASVKRSSGPHYGLEIRNVLFLAGDNRDAAWLFKSNSTFLRSLEQMKQWPYHDPDSRTIVLYYEFASADTNGDNELDRNDRFTVALGQPDVPNITEIIHDVDRVLAHNLVGDKTIAVIYQNGGQVWHARFRTDTLTKLSEQVVSAVPKEPSK